VLREYFGDKLVAQIDFAAVPRDPYPKMVPVFQQRVERALAERGHHVEWSTGLTAVEMDHGVTAHLDRGGNRAAIRAGWIVGCDGSHSIVRKTVSPDFPGQSVSGV
jgi:2-polyprenyl-6-methoxyphenol hydroxylase-like FAD-dependent oxidoreductase